MARERLNLERLLEEEKRLKEQITKKRKRLLQLKRKFQKEYRKREASFLIAIGRTLLKYGKTIETENGERFIVLPTELEQLKQAFREHDDVIGFNDDFAKWLKVLNIDDDVNDLM